MLSLLYSILAASAVLSAPMASLDADAFLQNGKEAQALNAEFANLKASDSCNSGEMACIGASVAHCVNSTWKEEACPKSLFCFALPSVREDGTVLSCTSNTTALSVINASGVTGGIAANSTDDSVDFPMDCDDDDEEDEDDCDDDDEDAQSSAIPTSSATGTRSRSGASQTASVSATRTSVSSATSAPSNTVDGSNGSPITVTVTVVPSSFSSDFSETTTLNPAQASSFLSSIATDTNFSIETTIRHAAPTASVSATSDAPESSAFSSKPVGIASSPAFTSDLGAPTTITLVGKPATAAATSSAAARATSAAAIDVGDSYYH